MPLRQFRIPKTKGSFLRSELMVGGKYMMFWNRSIYLVMNDFSEQHFLQKAISDLPLMVFGKIPRLQDTSLVAGLMEGYKPAKFQNSEISFFARIDLYEVIGQLPRVHRIIWGKD